MRQLHFWEDERRAEAWKVYINLHMLVKKFNEEYPPGTTFINPIAIGSSWYDPHGFPRVEVGVPWGVRQFTTGSDDGGKDVIRDWLNKLTDV